MKFIAPFITITIENVIYYILYKKKIDIDQTEDVGSILEKRCYEIDGIWGLSP